MTTVERTQSIPAGPDAVWQVLAEYDTISTWSPSVDHSCLLSNQTEGVGAVRRVQVGRTTLVETVAAWAPNEQLSYEIAGLPPMVGHITNTWTLEPETSGTKVTLTTKIDAGSRPLKRAVATVVARKFAAASDEMLDGLAEHIKALEATS